jgi:hypothetical protein
MSGSTSLYLWAAIDPESTIVTNPVTYLLRRVRSIIARGIGEARRT